MSNPFFDKLSDTLNELEKCIVSTRDAMGRKGTVPAHVLERVDEYSRIIEKQRVLVGSLKEQIEIENWHEVARCVRLISGLSVMVRDDAAALIKGAPGAEESEKAGSMLC